VLLLPEPEHVKLPDYADEIHGQGDGRDGGSGKVDSGKPESAQAVKRAAPKLRQIDDSRESVNRGVNIPD
jgi:hypothetical protein